MFPVVKVIVFAVVGLPAVSVTEPVNNVNVYLVFAFSFVVWVMVSVFPMMDLPIFTRVPLLAFSSIR